ncbi:MAG: hypothetical protein AAGA56_12065 [Myxococcota bacterium]
MRALLLASALSLLSMGCGQAPVASVVTAALALPPGGSVTDDEIVVPRNRAVALVVQPMNGEETLKVDIELEPVAPLVEVWPIADGANHFLVVGVQTGVTTLRVTEGGLDTNVTLSVEVFDPNA